MAFVSGRLRDRESLDRGDPHGHAFYSSHRNRGLSGAGGIAGGGFGSGGRFRQIPFEKKRVNLQKIVKKKTHDRVSFFVGKEMVIFLYFPCILLLNGVEWV